MEEVKIIFLIKMKQGNMTADYIIGTPNRYYPLAHVSN